MHTNISLKVLNVLMTAKDWMTIRQISKKIGCSDESVRKSIDTLERSGFPVEVERRRLYNMNYYRYSGKICGWMD